MRRWKTAKVMTIKDFNPRIPCGMRQDNTVDSQLVKEFQSTHPMRDAT